MAPTQPADASRPSGWSRDAAPLIVIGGGEHAGVVAEAAATG